jgi:hypothetical protein
MARAAKRARRDACSPAIVTSLTEVTHALTVYSAVAAVAGKGRVAARVGANCAISVLARAHADVVRVCRDMDFAGWLELSSDDRRRTFAFARPRIHNPTSDSSVAGESLEFDRLSRLVVHGDRRRRGLELAACDAPPGLLEFALLCRELARHEAYSALAASGALLLVAHFLHSVTIGPLTFPLPHDVALIP